MNEFIVKFFIEYKRRDGSNFFIRAKKKFIEQFVPTIGWRVLVEDDDDELSSEVTEICWNSARNLLVCHTRLQVYSDGNVDQSFNNHVTHLQKYGWVVQTPAHIFAGV